MTGTAQDQKKAYRIVSHCKAFFPWYEPQIKDKFERQAFDELKAAILPEAESYTDATKLVADRQKFADKTLLMQICKKSSTLRRLDPEQSREERTVKWQKEREQFKRAKARKA